MHEIRILIDERLRPSEDYCSNLEAEFGVSVVVADEDVSVVSVTFAIEPHVDVCRLLAEIGERFFL